MSQQASFAFAEPDVKNAAAVKEAKASRKSKPLSRKSDPASSHRAGVMFRESGGKQTHEDIILNALYTLGKATGHELAKEIARVYPDKPMSDVQVIQRTGAMEGVAHGECRKCICGKQCQEMWPE